MKSHDLVVYNLCMMAVATLLGSSFHHKQDMCFEDEAKTSEGLATKDCRKL